MKRLVLASNNKGKIVEIKKLLEKFPIEVFSLKDMGIDIDVVEDGLTFEENAKKKSVEIYKELIKRGETDFIVMSDDSGLEVDYLNGEPGVFSARYAGEHGNDKKNNEKLLNKLSGVKKDDRKARFVCELALINDKNEYFNVKGHVEGIILEKESGDSGFGYDPLFLYEPFNKSFAEMSMEEKNKISHRGIALQKAVRILESLI
ncbi:XTP/dITP diphosphatase [Clostridium tertium]|uniref:dITP/XTP pyrophosphatase n=1 Tax=Clostridium tertium TaxID=1559 RepID=A0A6N3GA34_9CLOT